MSLEHSRCFAWVINLKKSCSERWAKFRNRFRRRFYARRGQTLDPSTILNETGTKDIVISKKLYKSNKVGPCPAFEKTTDYKAESEVFQAEDGTYYDKLVEEYVNGIISTAAEFIHHERQQSVCNTAITTVKEADDNVSLSSSIISQIADAAVTESLTQLVLDSDKNQSAKCLIRPRTLSEFMELFGIAREPADNVGLPSVS